MHVVAHARRATWNQGGCVPAEGGAAVSGPGRARRRGLAAFGGTAA